MSEHSRNCTLQLLVDPEHTNEISIKFHQKYPQNQAAKTTVHTDGDPNYCIIRNKRRLLLRSLCCWGWTSQVICLLTSLYSLSYLRMGPAAPIKRFPASEAPPVLWHWTRSCHMHLTVSTSSEKKKLLDYPTLNSTCRWYCWYFCHQSIHQPIKFTSTRLHKRLHNNMVKVKTVPVPQTKTKQKTTRISAVMTLWVPVTRYHQRKAREHGMSWKNITIRTPLIH
jgi:hypothetical protein